MGIRALLGVEYNTKVILQHWDCFLIWYVCIVGKKGVLNMEVKIYNCGNVLEGKFSLVEWEFNIKYGINGLGKTSISRGIYYALSSPEKIESLKTILKW